MVHGIVGKPDGAGLLEGLRLERHVLELEELAPVRHPVLAPEPAEDGDVLLEPPLALRHRHADRPSLGAPVAGAPASGADDQDRAALGDPVEARPLVGEDERVAEGKARQAGRAEAQAPRAAGDGGEQGERVEPGLGEQGVAHPDGVEDAGGLGAVGQIEKLGRRRQAQHDAPVRERQPEGERWHSREHRASSERPQPLGGVRRPLAPGRSCRSRQGARPRALSFGSATGAGPSRPES